MAGQLVCVCALQFWIILGPDPEAKNSNRYQQSKSAVAQGQTARAYTRKNWGQTLFCTHPIILPVICVPFLLKGHIQLQAGQGTVQASIALTGLG